MKSHIRTGLGITTFATVFLALAGCSVSPGDDQPASSQPSSTTAGGVCSPANPDATPVEGPDYAEYGPRGEQDGAGMRVAFLAPATQLVSQKSAVAGFQAAAAELGIQLDVYDAGGFANVDKQVGQFETAMSSGVDAIIIMPTSPVAFTGPIAEAKKAGIAVLDAWIPLLDSDGHVLSDVDYALLDPLENDGSALVQALSERLGGTGNIVLLFGGGGSTVNSLVKKGAHTALESLPGMVVAAEQEFTDFNAAAAQSAVETILVGTPDIQGVVANSTSLATGASNALRGAGINDAIVSSLSLDGVDQIQELREGHTNVIAQPPFYAGASVIMNWAVAIHNGTKPAQAIVAAEPIMLTTENIDGALIGGALAKGVDLSVLGCG